jgi:hypothetical protein
VLGMRCLTVKPYRDKVVGVFVRFSLLTLHMIQAEACNLRKIYKIKIKC